MPPCTPPESVLGSGPSDANGQFDIPVPPLAPDQCIYAFDTCADRTSPLRCAFVPAQAPTLSPLMLGVALGVLGCIARLRLRTRT